MKKRTTKKTAKRAKRTRKPSRPGKPSRAPKPSPRCRCGQCRSLELTEPLSLGLLGQIVEVKYVHAEDGKTYTHRFHDKPGIHIANHGRILVVHPVTVTRVAGKHFIGD